MAEPSSSLAGVVTALSAATVALVGVELHPLMWAFIGALIALAHGEKTTAIKASIFAFTSMMGGAALGVALLSQFGMDAGKALNAACLVCGAGTQPIIAFLIQKVTGAK